MNLILLGFFICLLQFWHRQTTNGCFPVYITSHIPSYQTTLQNKRISIQAIQFHGTFHRLKIAKLTCQSFFASISDHQGRVKVICKFPDQHRMLFLMENLAMLLDKKTVKTSKTLFWLHRLPKHAPKPAEDQHIKLHRESAVANRQGIKLIYNLFNPYWKVVLIRKTKKEHCKNKKNCQIALNLISSKLVARALPKICERSKHKFFCVKN